MIWLLFIGFACNGVGQDSAPDVIPPGCGDGVLDEDETCDNGGANSDTTPDACRTTCQLPACGDGVVDAGEPCDDGDVWGGDGCTPTCQIEAGALETEPNNSWDAAQPAVDDILHGALEAEDVDCYTFRTETCGAVRAQLIGDCPANATLNLHDPDGVLVAVSATAQDGCAMLDPEMAPGARFLAGGTWAVCVRGQLDQPVPYYSLEIDPIAPGEVEFTVDPSEDLDGDALPNQCDEDRDGDGIPDVDDNCPERSNGPDTPPLAPQPDGFIRTWLSVGPFTDLGSSQRCLPTDTDRVAEVDALARPAIADEALETGRPWRVQWSTANRIDYLGDFGFVEPPREVYSVVYVRSDVERDVTLAIGPDDGARAWMDEVEVMSIDGCQGTNPDRFQEPVTLPAGWSRLMFKVHDQGGGWGNFARFLDAEGAPVTDLELSLDPSGSWTPDQTDSDGDGIGDICDPTP